MRCVRKQVEHRDAVAGVARVHEQSNIACSRYRVATNQHHFACFGECKVFYPSSTKAVTGRVGNDEAGNLGAPLFECDLLNVDGMLVQIAARIGARRRA